MLLSHVLHIAKNLCFAKQMFQISQLLLNLMLTLLIQVNEQMLLYYINNITYRGSF